MISKIKQIINKGHTRSVKAKKHILASLFLKGLSIVVSFLLVPLILGYLDAERYGIWLVLSSIIAWFSFFNIGLGNGLRNRFAEALALENCDLAKTYVSTTYAILGIIVVVILFVFNLIIPFLNWQAILNTTLISNKELIIIVMVVFLFFILRLYLQLIGTILLANQRPAINNSFGPIGNIIALLIIFILTKTTEGSLLILSLTLSSIPAIVLLIATIYYFKNDYKDYRPKLKFIDFRKSRDLVGLSLKFFYFEIGSLIFFSTTNFLITQVSDPKAVTEYNIVFKYFFLANMIYGIILTPFWTAVTEAYSKQDINWIKNSLRKLNLLSLAMTVFLVLLLLISDWIYLIWLGDKITISVKMSIVVMIYMIIQVNIAPFSTFINGFGKLKLGVYSITAKLIIYIPAAILLGKEYGAIGIVIAMGLVQLLSLVLEPIQVHKIINGRAVGIWNE